MRLEERLRIIQFINLKRRIHDYGIYELEEIIIMKVEDKN